MTFEPSGKISLKPSAIAALFEQIARCLEISSTEGKCQAVGDLWQAVQSNHFEFDPHTAVSPMGLPGHPDRPELVKPSKLHRRRLGSEAGRAALVHAVAHIEFNAINLALDAAFRFREMPRQYYLDWLSVAADESRHFSLLSTRLQSMGYQYGDFPAHNGLWEMAQRTADDCMHRMAMVPRVLEARGLDVTPGMIRRLQSVDDFETARILETILEEEVRHVEIGSHWFRSCCDQRGVDPEATFVQLVKTYYGASLRGPFNMHARIKAGFTQREMDALLG